MFEMSDPGKHHCNGMLIRRTDHIRIANGTAGLNHRGRARFHSLQETVGKGKERVRCDNRPVQIEAGFSGFLRGNARRVDA